MNYNQGKKISHEMTTVDRTGDEPRIAQCVMRIGTDGLIEAIIRLNNGARPDVAVWERGGMQPAFDFESVGSIEMTGDGPRAMVQILRIDHEGRVRVMPGLKPGPLIEVEPRE